MGVWDRNERAELAIAGLRLARVTVDLRQLGQHLDIFKPLQSSSQLNQPCLRGILANAREISRAAQTAKLERTRQTGAYSGCRRPGHTRVTSRHAGVAAPLGFLVAVLAVATTATDKSLGLRLTDRVLITAKLRLRRHQD